MRKTVLWVATPALLWTAPGLALAQSDAGATCDGGETERCDCQDNDCDGATDEPGTCYGSASVFCSPVWCKCLWSCRGGGGDQIPRLCDVGQVCVHYPNGQFCEPLLCEDHTCDDDEYCAQTMGGVVTCHPRCEVLTCGPCQTCEGGACVTTCETGSICVDGVCVALNCEESHCAPPQICCAGRCIEGDACTPVDSGVDEQPAATASGSSGCAVGGPRSRGVPFWMLLAAVVRVRRRARREGPAHVSERVLTVAEPEADASNRHEESGLA